jgi:hypothetical protein
MANMKPSPADIDLAIQLAELGGWLDPSDHSPGLLWHCDLIGPDGTRYGDGDARTAGEAMALAWLAYWQPDALWLERVELGSVPYNIPDDWRFELTPPSRGKHLH